MRHVERTGVAILDDPDGSRLKATCLGSQPKLIDRAGLVQARDVHLAKDLEFRCVAVMACDDQVIPSPQRIETVADDVDLEEVYTRCDTSCPWRAHGPAMNACCRLSSRARSSSATFK